MGATDHICHDLKLFDSHYGIKSVGVRLPNGASVVANVAGSVPVTENLVLKNVLYLILTSILSPLN